MKDEIIINKEMQHIIIGNTKYYGIAPELLDCITNLQEENEKLNNIIDELDKEFNWQRKKQIDIDKFAQEQGFLNYNPVRLMVENFINKLQKLKENKQ